MEEQDRGYGALTVVDIVTGRSRRIYQPETGGPDGEETVEWSPDGRSIALSYLAADQGIKDGDDVVIVLNLSTNAKTEILGRGGEGVLIFGSWLDSHTVLVRGGDGMDAVGVRAPTHRRALPYASYLSRTGGQMVTFGRGKDGSYDTRALGSSTSKPWLVLHGVHVGTLYFATADSRVE